MDWLTWGEVGMHSRCILHASPHNLNSCMLYEVTCAMIAFSTPSCRTVARPALVCLPQAVEAPSRLSGLSVDYVISSPFKRCLQTSAGVVRGLRGLPEGHWLVDWQLAEVRTSRGAAAAYTAGKGYRAVPVASRTQTTESSGSV